MTETERLALRAFLRGYREWRAGRGLPRAGGPAEVKLLEALRAEGVEIREASPPPDAGDSWEAPSDTDAGTTLDSEAA